jgi:hypothetical protein
VKLSSGLRLCGFTATASVLLWLGAGRVESQDVSLRPTYGTATLRAGFAPDPYRVANVVSGGAVQTSKGGIDAWVADAPDFRLNYTAGALPLTFRFVGTGDTTLLINTPDGRWVADDDSDGNLNPRVTFNSPRSGQYDVWVGTVPKRAERGTLMITELRP